MAHTGTSHESLRGESLPLAERISELFSNRYAQLEKLRTAKRVTPADLQFLKETEGLIADCEGSNAGDLDGGSVSVLNSLRSLLERANVAVDSAVVVEEGDSGKRKKKKHRDDEPGAEEFSGEEESAPAFATERPLVARKKEFAGNEAAQWWFDGLIKVEKMIGNLEHAKKQDQRRLFEAVVPEYTAIVEAFDQMQDGINRAGYSLQQYPFLVVVLQELNALAERLEAVSSPKSAERGPALGPEAEALRVSFETEIEQYDANLTYFEQLPLSTAEDLALARKNLDTHKANIIDLGRDWNEKISPILDAVKAGRNDGRLGPVWGGLAKRKGQLIRRFFGSKERKDAEGNVTQNAEDGVLQTMGRKIREHSRELRREAWERDFPAFVVDIAKLRVTIQGARLREGENRVETLEVIQGDFDRYAEQWETLRVGGPVAIFLDRGRGSRSPVRQYDILMNQLRRDLKNLKKYAKTARPARLDRVAFEWSEALLGARQFWNPETRFRDRMTFLHRYGSGEASEEEVAWMIPAEQRMSFALVADGDVLEDLRARGEVNREERAKIERQERAELYHPQLEMLRLLAKDAYRSALQGTFWKDGTRQAAREKLLVPDIAAIPDADLEQYVSDIPAYRAAYGEIDTAYAEAKKVEDRLYIEGTVPEVRVHIRQLGSVLGRYRKAKVNENHAWHDALSASAWRVSGQAQIDAMRGTYQAFLLHGKAAFKEIPPPLRGPVIGWILCRMRLRTIGNYTQWVINENPALSRGAVKYIPEDFTIPGGVADEEDDDEFTPEYLLEMLGLPAPITPGTEQRGGGAFDEDGEASAAAGLSREDGEGGVAAENEENEPERTITDADARVGGGPSAVQEGGDALGVPELNAMDRERTLETDGVAIIKRLTEV